MTDTYFSKLLNTELIASVGIPDNMIVILGRQTSSPASLRLFREQAMRWARRVELFQNVWLRHIATIIINRSPKPWLLMLPWRGNDAHLHYHGN